jgi:hypothetical protein
MLFDILILGGSSVNQGSGCKDRFRSQAIQWFTPLPGIKDVP